MDNNDKAVLDYFAGQAMQVLYAEGIAVLDGGRDSPEFDVIAKDSYRLAKAMMEERRKYAAI